MTGLTIERRLRWAGLLIVAGLAILFVSLLRVHPLAFVVYLTFGCPLILAGVLLYLHTLAVKDGDAATKMMTIALLFVLPLAASGCGGSDIPTPRIPPPVEKAKAPELPSFDPSSATGRVSGSVVFDGKRPEVPAMTIGGDAVCKMNAMNIRNDKELVTADGKLRNAIVYVRSGHEGRSYTAPSEPAVLDQRGCVYVPHTLTLMKGQKLRILNSDDSFHNVHAQDGPRTEFNIGQSKKGAENTQTFSRAVMPFRIACDFHKWMNAYVGVFDHPFHATTSDSGTYELHLPGGKYVIAAWHEKYGEQVAQTEVRENGKVEVNFKFTASEGK